MKETDRDLYFGEVKVIHDVLCLQASYEPETFHIRSIRVDRSAPCLTLILRRSRTGTVWFYNSTSNKRAARPKLYTKSLTGDLKLMYSRFTLVRISINL